ncbi:helix-turn-helix transcriptional regulator [Vallitalea pronyensis]|uniref:Helix-turn-helix transcriptional regulator n=1 Tax=Vallitalea pronyensis TaxID=1348613 RepID=A0A8J8MPX3_9FIRM|nr:AraC family transcriptional regulator [Vallitalea pronyensis]QUI25402.1 helix-turn-helix transcriptional regulator [Vallitalea pronyensis]
MNWIQSLSKAINYVENHLSEDISIDEIASQVYSSSSHFQFVFHVVMGMTIGEYIRNRRLSCAAQDLLQSNSKMIDVAMRYQYDSRESFSKAFKRFHGVPPSKVQLRKVKIFHPLSINVTIKGGFDMSRHLIDEFYWNDIEEQKDEKLTGEEKYKRIVSWAGKARGQNPSVFDALTEWVLDDSQWSEEKLAENEQILMQGVFGRFKEQNAQLRTYLSELEPSGVVNPAAFKALDRFDNELSGLSHDKGLQEVVAQVFADFSAMEDPSIREQIAGNKTGPTGTNSVDLYGYINHLKDCDAGVQWALFMPDVVEKQQNGFKVDSFEYKKMPAMRFIGKEVDDLANTETRKGFFAILDTMNAYKSDLGYDVLFMHHYGLGVDVGPWHGVWGRFMRADTPVPEGFLYFDFIPQSDGKVGAPYISQFAYATFSGDMDAMHKREGYDCDAMYDVTRNIMLGEGVNIPYPDKYWTAEVFLNGCDKYSTAFMFSAEL